VNINATLIGQAIWFALFIWFVMKAVWPYFQRIIAERQKHVADGLAAAERGRHTLELSMQQAEDEVKRARERAAEIVAQAEKRSAQLIEDARSAARDEGAREKAAAQAEIEQQYAHARIFAEARCQNRPRRARADDHVVEAPPEHRARLDQRSGCSQCPRCQECVRSRGRLDHAAGERQAQSVPASFVLLAMGRMTTHSQYSAQVSLRSWT